MEPYGYPDFPPPIAISRRVLQPIPLFPTRCGVVPPAPGTGLTIRTIAFVMFQTCEELRGDGSLIRFVQYAVEPLLSMLT